jgi:hypothetical protein
MCFVDSSKASTTSSSASLPCGSPITSRTRRCSARRCGIDDPELVAKIEELSGACIVVRKQPHRDEHAKQQLLRDLNERTPGLPVQAFPDLANLGPKVEGEPLVVGPYSRMYEGAVPTIRTLGYRKTGNVLVPIMHAKLALLGQPVVD